MSHRHTPDTGLDLIQIQSATLSYKLKQEGFCRISANLHAINLDSAQMLSAKVVNELFQNESVQVPTHDKGTSLLRFRPQTLLLRQSLAARLKLGVVVCICDRREVLCIQFMWL